MSVSLFIETEEICVNEVFRPHCPQGHIILMVDAMYGRMSRGRCIDSDNVLGCKADVIQLLDSLCSGFRSCEVKVPSSQLDGVSTTCDDEVRTYLSVSYNCLPGIYDEYRFCTVIEVRRVSAGVYFSSSRL